MPARRGHAAGHPADGPQEFVADGASRNRTRLRLAIDGTERELDYAGRPKYLSTVLHVTLARAMVATGAPRWLAWSDQGVRSTALAPGGVERLNVELAPATGTTGGWEWVAEQEPVAASDPMSR